jgi:hypothetical protein
MGVAAQIAQRVFGAAERSLGIDHPIGPEQRAQPGGECLRRLKVRKRSVKSQLAPGVEFAKACQKIRLTASIASQVHAKRLPQGLVQVAIWEACRCRVGSLPQHAGHETNIL